MHWTSVFVVALAAGCSGPRFNSGLFGNGELRPGDLAGDAGVGASGAAPDAKAPLAHVGGTGGTAYGGVPSQGGSGTSAGGAQGGSGGAISGAPGEDGGRPGANGADAGIAGAGSGGAGGAPDCPTLGQKKCAGECAYPSPKIGCALTGCDPCPAPPANAATVCPGLECEIECNSGYELVSAACEPVAASGGTGGGGAVVECTVGQDCPDCSFVSLYLGCCRDNACSCSFTPDEGCRR